MKRVVKTVCALVADTKEAINANARPSCIVATGTCVRKGKSREREEYLSMLRMESSLRFATPLPPLSVYASLEQKRQQRVRFGVTRVV